MTRAMITGANGFIGKHLCLRLKQDNLDFCAVVRQKQKLSPELQHHALEMPEFSPETIAGLDFSGIECVIHLAAIAHKTSATLNNELAAYRNFNTVNTVALAKAAWAAGVKRFIFLSSIGVNGTQSEHPFTAQDIPAPQEPYAISKLEAEEALRAFADSTGLELVIIRPPLVYGYNAPGNFGKLRQLALKALPIPLGAIQNKRSFVAIDNLIDLVYCCIFHPAAAGNTFLVSDDQDISTTGLMRALINASGSKAILLPVPLWLLKLVASLLGRRALLDRLCGNLQLDISHTKKTLGWRPVVSVEQGIKRCFNNEEVC